MPSEKVRVNMFMYGCNVRDMLAAIQMPQCVASHLSGDRPTSADFLEDAAVEAYLMVDALEKARGAPFNDDEAASEFEDKLKGGD